MKKTFIVKDKVNPFIREYQVEEGELFYSKQDKTNYKFSNLDAVTNTVWLEEESIGKDFWITTAQEFCLLIQKKELICLGFKQKSNCDCGGAKLKLTHSHWCSSLKI
jgi:hypothetical protein